MQLTRAPEDNLAGLPIDLDADSRILGGQLLERASEPLLVVRRLRRDWNGEESCFVACAHLNPVGLVLSEGLRPSDSLPYTLLLTRRFVGALRSRGSARPRLARYLEPASGL